MIGVVEVLKVAQRIIEANRTASPNAAFGIYLTVFLLYFLVCWPISLLARKTGTKMEVTGDVRLIAGNKEPDQALW